MYFKNRYDYYLITNMFNDGNGNIKVAVQNRDQTIYVRVGADDYDRFVEAMKTNKPYVECSGMFSGLDGCRC